MIDRRLRLISGSPEAAGRILGLLDDTTIRVLLPSDPPWRRQLLALALVDLLGRLFPRIEISGADAAPAHPLLPPGDAMLRDRLEAVRAHGVAPLPPGDGPSVLVVVGEGPADEPAIYTDGDGWQSYLGSAPSLLAGDGDQQVPFGPLAAACRAAAQAFAVAMADVRGVPRELGSEYWSALTLKTSEEPLAMPDLPAPTHLAAVLGGAGSIGGAGAYAFARVPSLTGDLDVVDPQPYAPHNPDRALLATEALAAAGAEKAAAIVDALRHLTGLAVHPFRGTFREWVASRPVAPVPLVLCGFDSVASRRELQDALPLEVINAACGEDNIAVSGHRTGEGPCVYCLHVPDVLNTERITFKLIVSSTGLPPEQVQRWMEHHVRLDAGVLTEIERRTGRARGTLAPYVGRTLLELHRKALAYGEDRVEIDDATAAVAAPWVTALAGFMLAAEALKAGDHDHYAPHRLGPWTPGRTRYEEHLYSSARHAIVSPVPRWDGSECLCRSTRRLRLLAERYGV